MAKILTDDDVDSILKARKSFGKKKNYVRYYKLTEDDGEVIIKFDSPINRIEMGDKDLIGNEWPYDSPKNEAMAFIDDKKILWNFGGPRSPNLATFLTALKKKEIPIDEMPGSIWKASRIGKYKYQYEFVGMDEEDLEEDKKEEKPKKKGKSKKKGKKDGDVEVNKAIKAIKSLKKDNPEFVEGMKVSGLITAITIQTDLNKDDVEGIIKELEKREIISVDDGTVDLSDI